MQRLPTRLLVQTCISGRNVGEAAPTAHSPEGAGCRKSLTQRRTTVGKIIHARINFFRTAAGLTTPRSSSNPHPVTDTFLTTGSAKSPSGR